MTIYRVWAKYEPDHINLAAGRKGQWRVVRCNPAMMPLSSDVIYFGDDLGIRSTKPYPRGSIIRPHKELNRVLALRHDVTNEALDKMNKERVYP